MTIIKGKTACGGIAIGRARIYRREESLITRYHIDSSDNEITRFENARKRAIEELEELYSRAVSDIGEASAAIFNIHIEMLSDPDYIESVKNLITDELINAETAVGYTCDSFVQMFADMKSDYMRGRDMDIRDVSERVIRILEGKTDSPIDVSEPVIIIADDLAPSETVQFDAKTVLAIVTENGSSNSHTSILARMMNIPAVTGAKGILSESSDGMEIIVDGTDGTIYAEPDYETRLIMEDKRHEYSARVESLSRLKGKETRSSDGQSIALYANIGNVLDAGGAVLNDAEGIGLFRSEFLYLESYDFPSEESQFKAYRKVLAKMYGKRVVIRTLDIGADKQVGYFRMPEEANPAIGMRGIRICLERADLFKIQLRALYRASVYGNLAIMFPMITSAWEIDEILEIIDEVKTELASQGIAYSDDVPLGCMIETPAAALIADDLAKKLSFFSIGTNDLTQYALAADRSNPHIGEYYNPHHKAVLRLIRETIEAAHRNGITAGICGELASDLNMTEVFLALGADNLSVVPGMILAVRDKVRNTDVSAVKDKIIKEITG